MRNLASALKPQIAGKQNGMTGERKQNYQNWWLGQWFHKRCSKFRVHFHGCL